MTYQFSLKVTNEYDMTDTTSVRVDVVKDAIPTIEMTNPATKYNVEDKIVLTGTVTNDAGAVSAFWTADGLDSGVELADLSLTSSTFTLSAGVSVVQIALRPYALVEGTTYTFYLNSAYEGSTAASASVNVLMNEAPTGGTLTVSPTEGIALNTTFTFETAGWSDDEDDYPLEYIFAYYVSFQYDQNIIKSASELSYSTARIGAGKSNDGSVVCVANASDTYGATGTTFNTDVSVTPLTSTAEIKDLADSQISRAFKFFDPTAVNNIVTGVTTSLNSVDCNTLARAPF